jgi:hypothetical protein
VKAETIDQFKQYITYTAENVTQDKYGLFPEIDITENVNLMGDIDNQDKWLMKAYSQFDIQLDYLALQNKSMSMVDELMKYFREIGNDVYVTTKTAWPPRSDKTYHEHMKDDLIADFKKDYKGPRDSTYYSKLADYEDTIDSLISIEKTGNYAEP